MPQETPGSDHIKQMYYTSNVKASQGERRLVAWASKADVRRWSKVNRERRDERTECARHRHILRH